MKFILGPQVLIAIARRLRDLLEFVAREPMPRNVEATLRKMKSGGSAAKSSNEQTNSKE